MNDFAEHVMSTLQADEARVIVGQTKLSPTESAQLDQLVVQLRLAGTPATRSSVIRAATLAAIEELRAI
ncbi:hypothetical protein K8O93_00800 [Gordonia bronchialis]|uniref:hypothetical protein n=1 Tax=Gordonia bronchialis TaxID=2054 RepID=UPI001CBF63BF|nr:hypothetical protein [Gordonia bronchialis]UAK38372.1 hypothetical protein K8O93_00800 [Gordonia bronchialis]